MYPNAACLLECSVCEKVAENSEKSQLSNEVFKFFVKIKKKLQIFIVFLDMVVFFWVPKQIITRVVADYVFTFDFGFLFQLLSLVHCQ